MRGSGKRRSGQRNRRQKQENCGQETKNFGIHFFSFPFYEQQKLKGPSADDFSHKTRQAAKAMDISTVAQSRQRDNRFLLERLNNFFSTMLANQ
jgi:hypothetical protein